jgi:hypothetical protein
MAASNEGERDTHGVKPNAGLSRAGHPAASHAERLDLSKSTTQSVHFDKLPLHPDDAHVGAMYAMQGSERGGGGGGPRPALHGPLPGMASASHGYMIHGGMWRNTGHP